MHSTAKRLLAAARNGSLAAGLAVLSLGCVKPSLERSSPVDQLVAQLRDTPSPAPMDEFCQTGIAAPDGSRETGIVCPTAGDGALRREIYTQLVAQGPAGAAALGRAYQDPDVRLRRAAALALEMLGGHYDPRYDVLDIEPALPGLQDGLRDDDERVRSWSAQALGHLGACAAPAVPALIRLLSSTHEADRNSACIGLQGIGPAARDALPALSRALADPSGDVRRFAQHALAAIGTDPG